MVSALLGILLRAVHTKLHALLGQCCWSWNAPVMGKEGKESRAGKCSQDWLERAGISPPATVSGQGATVGSFDLALWQQLWLSVSLAQASWPWSFDASRNLPPRALAGFAFHTAILAPFFAGF